MDPVTIRLAGAPDLEALFKLYVDFHEFHVRGVPDRLLSLGEPEAYDCSKLYANLEKIISHDDSALFVAKVAGQVLGFVEIYVRQDEPNPARVSRTYGHLQSLMVDEGFRRRGVGTRLVEAAEQWAREKGAAEMQLDTWEFAAGSLEFYEHSGYRTLRRTLVREL
jgi:ribosomal protein S18 acetylase RimI-like enzyme